MARKSTCTHIHIGMTNAHSLVHLSLAEAASGLPFIALSLLAGVSWVGVWASHGIIIHTAPAPTLATRGDREA